MEESFPTKKWIMRGLVCSGRSIIRKCISRDNGQQAIAKMFKKTNRNQERYQVELDILKELSGSHSSLPVLFDTGEDKDHYYLIMEEIKGGDLLDYVNLNGRVSESEAFEIFSQLVDIIEYLHQRNIIHHDIKLENVLLVSLETKKIKLLDFEFCIRIKDSPIVGAKRGTQNYVAPEVIMCDQYDGCKNDIWGAGVILYALLTGKLPFDHQVIESPKEFISRMRNGLYNEPAYLSAEVKSLLAGILCGDPNERYTIQRIKNHPWFIQKVRNQAQKP